jgi:hypothetical protein
MYRNRCYWVWDFVDFKFFKVKFVVPDTIALVRRLADSLYPLNPCSMQASARGFRYTNVRPRQQMLPRPRFEPCRNTTKTLLRRSVFKLQMVHPTGFEPTTFGSASQRSIQLSYGCSSELTRKSRFAK